MSQRVLLLEPYPVLAYIIVDILQHLGYVADVVSSGSITLGELHAHPYHCAFINLDQNSFEWRDKGLKLAATVSQAGLPVVIIPDHETDVETIAANGWIYVPKPFRIQDIAHAISQTVGRRQE